MAADAARDPATFPVTIWGNPDDAANLKRYQDAGAARFVFSLPSAKADEILPMLDRLPQAGGKASDGRGRRERAHARPAREGVEIAMAAITPKITQIASGLRFPEGPVAMPDRSIILVEIERRTLSRVPPEGK